jgi:hypothetical protein
MYERRHQPLLPRRQWLGRVARSVHLALKVVTVSLIVGVLGYHLLGGISWVDSLLESCMILAGMGPVAAMQNDVVKIFASFYALFSGFVLLAASGIVIAPFLHRLLHHFHADAGDAKTKK